MSQQIETMTAAEMAAKFDQTTMRCCGCNDLMAGDDTIFMVPIPASRVGIEDDRAVASAGVCAVCAFTDEINQ